MTYQAAAFREYFLRTGHKASTCNTHNSYLKQIDRVIGGLDEKIAADGIDKVLAWGKTTSEGPFEDYPSHSKAVLKRYLEFVVAGGQADDDDETDNPDSPTDDVETSGALFRLESEMQAAIRSQLSNLEAGLKEADGGAEVAVATGRIDIVAEDAKGDLVVIELKAGICPKGALEQALGYAEALSVERGKPVRAFLIASEFPDRVRAAARRVRDLELRTYKFQMQFDSVDQ